MNKEIHEFIQLSRYAGERFDLVQAGGGNSSVKLQDGTMLIKASGFRLSEVNEHTGYTIIDNQLLTNILSKQDWSSLNKKEREKLAQQYVTQATLTPQTKPSIETTLHTLLATYTLHTHPITVNAIACQPNWQQELQALFKNENPFFVPYQTPGIDLARSLTNILEHASCSPLLIFLQNHGLIVSAPARSLVQQLTDHVVITIEKALGIDFSVYRLTNVLSKHINNICNSNIIIYLSTDKTINDILTTHTQLANIKPFCPDTLVYCGYTSIRIDNLHNQEPYSNYYHKYQQHPKVIFHKNHLFFAASSVKKAKEIEEQYKFHLMTLMSNNNVENLNMLALEEQHYLTHWDAEKFRQII